ncbi:hypothetical protein D1632_09675 [Chryseobacterium nematophagum]|uniref:Uncharacterized protein n=1 Tax=Chryseobacterium nematophagum TaxID=2305228 RepID=A0A3M7LBF7_9FLAO|nr:hypothetical protein [Chryseobacterium nematophagum]RMZ59867.1 hypothetical protein D1632_09675 [Chryseobacterium nematophagum]
MVKISNKKQVKAYIRNTFILINVFMIVAVSVVLTLFKFNFMLVALTAIFLELLVLLYISLTVKYFEYEYYGEVITIYNRLIFKKNGKRLELPKSKVKYYRLENNYWGTQLNLYKRSTDKYNLIRFHYNVIPPLNEIELNQLNKSLQEAEVIIL